MSPNLKNENLELIKKSPILKNENLELIEKCQTKLHYLLICQRGRKKLQRDLKGKIINNVNSNEVMLPNLKVKCKITHE